jgi:hypothetical protein
MPSRGHVRQLEIALAARSATPQDEKAPDTGRGEQGGNRVDGKNRVHVKRPFLVTMSIHETRKGQLLRNLAGS